MPVRAIAGLIALLCLLGLAWETRARPQASFPSKIEKSCPAGPYYIPCFIMDEALSTQWDI